METAAPERTVSEPKDGSLAPPGEDDIGPGEELPPVLPLPQRKRRVHKRPRRRKAAPEPPEVIQTPSPPLQPTRTRAGREVRVPRRYGWE